MGFNDVIKRSVLEGFNSADISTVKVVVTLGICFLIAAYTYLCINERYLKKNSTIISSNLSLQQIGSTYSERILSRLSSNYTLLRLFGKDIRILKQLVAT